jgi:hypothetical protein
MEHQLAVVFGFACVVSSGGCTKARANPSVDLAVVGVASDRAAYAAQLALLEADVVHGIPDFVDLPDHPCPPGEQLWQRDANTAYCTAACTTDADCQHPNDRCRVFSANGDEAGDVVLADELDAEDAAALDEPEVGWFAMCDPFWEVEGALVAALDHRYTRPDAAAELAPTNDEASE